MSQEMKAPEPLSDYYITWQKLFRAKCCLDNLIGHVGDFAEANVNRNEEIERDIALIFRTLEDVLPEVETDD
jgi:hypothetical protein